MKTAVYVLLLSILPCLAWADRLSIAEAYMIYKKQVVVPCVEYVLRIQEMPVTEYSVSNWSQEIIRLYKSKNYEALIKDTPAEQREALVNDLRNTCKNTFYIRN